MCSATPSSAGGRGRSSVGGLPTNSHVTAQLVNCSSLGEYERFLLMGGALDEPGNVWGIHTPPEDWAR